MKQLRDRWPSKSSFILAAVSGAIGVNALARFPAEVAAHGGGAFFIPLLIAVASAGMPMMALEFGLGLCYQGSIVECMRKVDKRLEWIGWWSALLGALACACAVGFMAWAGVYVYDSAMALLANQPVPWAGDASVAQGYLNQYRQAAPTEDVVSSIARIKPVGSLLLALVLVWLLLYWAVRRGVPFLSDLISRLLPIALVIMAIFVIVIFRQHGLSAVDGVAQYLEPDWNALLRMDTWIAAYGEAFRSLLLGAGVFVAYASYRNRSDDATATAGIAVCAGIGMLFLLGMVASAAIGGAAAAMSQPTSDLLTGDFDAVFAVLASAVADIRIVSAQAVVSLLLFLALFLFAFLSALALLTSFVTALCDKFHLDWEATTARACAGGLLVTSLFSTNLGFDIRLAIDELSFPFGLALCAAAQCLTLGWGSDGVRRHLNAYSVFPVGGVWWSMIAVVIPAAFLAHFIVKVQQWLHPGSGGYGSGATFAAGVLPAVTALLIALSLSFLPRRGSA